MSQGTFFNTIIRLEAFKRIFLFSPKIDFFSKGLVQAFLVKNSQILKSSFFTCLCP